MSKISVIMPSLNVRAYIEKSLRSVMDQTLNDIDIICIDGGSKDGTLEIIEKLAESDSRIKVIHSGKRSYGYQVNQGIKAAEGEYIGIVETDDYIEKDMYKKLYESAADTSYPDIVKCNYNAYWIDRKGKLVFRRREIPKPHEFYRKIVNPLEQAFVPVEDWYLWNGIYKRSFINENDIVLSESPGAAFCFTGCAQGPEEGAGAAAGIRRGVGRDMPVSARLLFLLVRQASSEKTLL